MQVSQVFWISGIHFHFEKLAINDVTYMVKAIKYLVKGVSVKSRTSVKTISANALLYTQPHCMTNSYEND